MGAWARLGRWLPVLFVTGLIAWCYLVFMLDILIPLLDSPDKAQHEYGTGCTIAFNIIFALAMISFLRAVFTDPGYIPDSWSVHPDDLESGERTRLMLPGFSTMYDCMCSRILQQSGCVRKVQWGPQINMPGPLSIASLQLAKVV